MICPKHRHTLGKYWKQRRSCQYPTHKGGKKAVKTRDVVNVAMVKEILKLHEVVVPIGSGLLSTYFPHFQSFCSGKVVLIYNLSYFNSS